MAALALDHLNPQQREAVEAVDGAVLVVAGAGSGKTRVLTHRIAHLVEDCGYAPGEILAITFTNRAAREMLARVEDLLRGRTRAMWVMTFHAACARILRREADRIGYRPGFTIYDGSDQVRLVKDVLESELEKDPKRYPPRGIHARISDAKNQLKGPEEFAAEVSGFFDTTVAEVYARYQRRLAQAGAMDFDDLLLQAVRLLEDVPDVRQKWQSAFRQILVDEYQDTNHAQYRLVRALSEQHGNVCVVGDGDQSIYSWRGADMRNILDFERDFPDARVIRLEQNYRSTQAILDAANAVIANNRERQPKRLWSENGRGESVLVVECADEGAEARYVVGRIATALQDGAAASDLAVLYRTNAQSRVIEDALRRQEVPYQVLGGLRFYDRAEIKDAMAYLQVLANPDDAVALRRVVNSPRRGIGDTTISRLVAHAEALGISLREAMREPDEVLPGAPARRCVREFSELLGRLEEAAATEPVGELLDRILDDTGYRESLRAERTIEARGKLENLEELVGVAREYDERERDGDEGGDLPGFLQELSLVSDVDADDRGERSLVTLMTLHTAKGLEFPTVFLIGLEDGVFPHQRAIEEANVEEERRLCYVGMTRAEKQLTLTYCRSRTLFGQHSQNPPSQFLAELDPSAIEHERLRVSAVSRTGWNPSPTRGVTGSGRTAGGWSGGGSASGPRRPVDVAPRVEAPLLATGDTVRHKAWGEGTVIQVATAEEIVVNFPSQGEKRLHVLYAPIEKVAG
jgi:DNA helicase-2/ATP-dependent DNA helicase PcrA